MSQAGRDARYGRQGGRVVPYQSKPKGTLPRCTVCGGAITYAVKRTKHYACDPDVMIGKRCSCAPGCTDQVVGDAGRCDPQCEVCRVMKGRLHKSIPEWS